MKKTIVSLIIIFCVLLALAGCAKMERESELDKGSMFVIIEGGGMNSYCIIYHKETKVMYAVSNGGYNAGTFTVMVNPDGSPMLWKGAIS